MRLNRDGSDVELTSSRKTRGLLGFLATSDRPVRRERLCEMLWDVPDDPRGALRWSLSKLRGLIDDGEACRLSADRETVRLDCASMDVDWRRLRSCADEDIRQTETGDLMRAATTLGGLFLQGLELPRCDSYQAWLVAMREEVKRWQTAILRELVKRPIDPERALQLAREWVAIDPFDALARVALIDLLERTARHGEAEQQRALSIRKLDEGHIPVPARLQQPSRPEPPAVQPTHKPGALPVQHVRFCTASDGTGLAYSVVGDGPPLVKAANWLNHLEHDWDSPVWRHWLEAIIAERRLIRYDERGNGLSDWDTEDISFEAFVDDLSCVADAAGLDRFDLLGISQGCSVSIAYSVRHPERIRRLILFGGYAAGWKIRALPQELEQREAMKTLTRSGWGQNNPAFRQMFTTLFFPSAGPEEIAWFNELQRLSTSPDNAVRLQEAFATIDVRPLLSEVKVPTMVLHARDDAVIPFSAGRALAAGIPGAAFVALDSNNHLLLHGDPAWDKALASMREFLA